MKQSINTAVPSPTPYGMWHTVGLSIGLILALVITQTASMFVAAPYIITELSTFSKAASNVQLISSNGTLTAISIITAAIVVTGALILLILLRQRFANGQPISEYLALKRFRIKWLIIGIAAWIGFTGLSELGYSILGQTPSDFFLPLFISANPRWVLVIAVIFIAPIYEELLFRGFIWQGIISSRMGAVGALLFTSLLFAMIHMQYAWFEGGLIFLLGLILGILRYYSRSLLLPIIIHMINNSFAMAMYWMS